MKTAYSCFITIGDRAISVEELVKTFGLTLDPSTAVCLCKFADSGILKAVTNCGKDAAPAIDMEMQMLREGRNEAIAFSRSEQMANEDPMQEPCPPKTYLYGDNGACIALMEHDTPASSKVELQPKRL